jgi:Notch-like protein
MGPTNEFKHVPVTSKDMIEFIKSIKNKKSSGYDEVSTNVLKASMPYILSPLTYIWNRSHSTGIFPSRLKYSQVHLIYKKGERTEMSNYRPISILTSFSKIFEKVTFNR